MSRQEFRRQRLLQLAQEQYLEDTEGLFMTEEQREQLLNSFISVKLEFHDLDGLQWTQTALTKRQTVHRPSILPYSTSSKPDRSPFTIWTNTDSPTYDVEATIRASPKNKKFLPSHSHHQPPPRYTKRNKRRIPITSQNFWRVESNKVDSLTQSFPLPPPMSHVYPQPRITC